MLAEERFALILNLLAEKRTATVQELCEALNASESTVRRDLTELDRQGRLNKVHGGATLPKRWLSAKSAASLRRQPTLSAPGISSTSTQAPPRWLWSAPSAAPRWMPTT